MDGCRKIYHANTDPKKAEIAILISDRVDFKTRKVVMDKQGHYIMIMDTFSRQKISKGIVELNATINQLDIINIYGLLHPTTVEYTFF